MTPEQLKYSILKIAFSGKLIEPEIGLQLPKVKKVDFAEAPFDIPDTWIWSTLGNCCEMYTGNSISESVKKAKYTGISGGLDYIATKDVTFDHAVVYNNGVRIPLDEDFRIAKAGAVLMCIEGGSAGRKIGIIDRDVCFGNKLCMFNSIEVANKYIYYYLQSHEFKKFFSDNISGIIGGVSIKKLKELPIPIPPVKEQNRVVSKVEELLPYVDRYTASYDKLEQFTAKFPEDMKKSILQYAVQGKLVEQRAEEGTGEELHRLIQADKQNKEGLQKKEKVFTAICDDEVPFDIPDTWKWVRLRELCDTDISYGIIKLGNEDSNGVKVLRCSDVKENRIIPDGIRTVSPELSEQFSRTVLCGGEIVINVRGTLGGCCVVPNSMAGYNVAREVAVIRQNHLVDAQYIVYLLLTKYFQSFMFHGLRGIAYKGLNMSTLAEFPVPLPPISEQKRIVARLEELLPLCERLK